MTFPGMRITLHCPLDCPGCGSRFEGAWIRRETVSQACPSAAPVHGDVERLDLHPGAQGRHAR